MSGYRSPLRVEWERIEPELKAKAVAPGAQGSIARALLAFSPVLVDFMEAELKERTPPPVLLEAVTAALSNIAHKSIAGTVDRHDQENALNMMLGMMFRELQPRLGFGRYPTARIFLPGQQ